MDLAALKTELDAGHPATGPYSDDHQAAADQLNAVNRTRRLTHLDSAVIYEATDIAEFQGKTAAQKEFVRDIWGLGDAVDIRAGSKARLVYASVFGAGSATVANLVAAVTVPSSRADELGLGTVTGRDVRAARRLS